MKLKRYPGHKIDRIAERGLAGFSIVLAAIGLAAPDWPRTATVLVCIVAVLLVLAAVLSELARRPEASEDYCDSDCHLADVANGEGERA